VYWARGVWWVRTKREKSGEMGSEILGVIKITDVLFLGSEKKLKEGDGIQKKKKNQRKGRKNHNRRQ